tara:strand:- start:142 stop:495 length:354 start_codon:yes stop_codon:yes gene_type:complete
MDHNKFKEKSFDQRIKESTNILTKYPDRVPIIVQKDHKCKNLNQIDKMKYLVPKDMTICQFTYIIRKRIHLNPSETLFITINNKMITSRTTISELYEMEKDNDGFIYIIYSSENTFG